MAHIVYALCGEGRGHSSRAVAVADTLRRRGHRVTFACDAPAAGALARHGAVRRVPGLRQVLRRNRVRLWATARANLPLTWRSPEIVAAAAEWLSEAGADLVVADHEPFVGRAARRADVPVVALSHQHVLTETRPRVPVAHWPSALGTALGIGVLAPPRPDAVVVPSFFFPPLRRGSRAVLTPPVLRDDVLALRPAVGDRVAVYLNAPDGAEGWLRALDGVSADVFGLDPDGPARALAPPGVRLRRPSRGGFLAALAAARAVVSTAGFTLLSEALHLGKPVLAVPNRGFFEQTVNALALEATGRGEAVVGRDLRAADVRGFLGRAGRRLAADVVEGVLDGAPVGALSLAA